MLSKRKIVWALPAVMYFAFFLWYTNLQGAFTEVQIDNAIGRMEAEQATAEEIARMRNFMETDNGKQFIMVNLMDFNPNPIQLPETGAGAQSQDLLSHYMEFMFPALLRRASHPVFAGTAIGPSMDLIGIEGAENWSQHALMRYRSRRDLLAIIANPLFSERHDYKMVALTKTIAYPVEVNLYLMNPRFLLGLTLLTVVLLLDALIFRRRLVVS